MALQYLSWLCYMRRAVPRSATVAGIAKRCSEIPELVPTLVVFVFTPASGPNKIFEFLLRARWQIVRLL